jgi:hypothetical protein
MRCEQCDQTREASETSCANCGAPFPFGETDVRTLELELAAPVLGSPLAAVYVPVFVAIGTTIVSLLLLLLSWLVGLLNQVGPAVIVLAMGIAFGVGPLVGVAIWLRSRGREASE